MLAADDRDAAPASGWLNAAKKELKEELIQVLTGKNVINSQDILSV